MRIILYVFFLGYLENSVHIIIMLQHKPLIITFILLRSAKSNIIMHKENIHDQSHKMKENTVVNVVHPYLGYIHNGWILYYSFCNHISLCIVLTIDISRYSSPYCLATLQCKPFSLQNLPNTQT